MSASAHTPNDSPASSGTTTGPRVNVLGVGVSVLNLNLAREKIAEALAHRKKGYICVTGVHGVMECQQDPALRKIHNQSFLTTPDGMPMVWVGRLRGFREMDRVYGPDLMLLICEFTQKSGHTHFFYGGADGVAEELQRNLEQKFPGIRIVGTCTPPFRPLTGQEEAAFIERIKTLKPDIIWVGLSTPKQERFMARYIGQLDTTLMFGVGAAFDFHAGKVRQAPRWIQRSGLEWLFRLLCEPRRLWRRYLRNNPLFLFNLARQWCHLKKYSLE